MVTQAANAGREEDISVVAKRTTEGSPCWARAAAVNPWILARRLPGWTEAPLWLLFAPRSYPDLLVFRSLTSLPFQ